jgi:hypothetical protein
MLARLPASARRRYKALAGQVDDAEARLRALIARLAVLEQNADDIMHRLGVLDEKLDAAEIADLKEELQELSAERADIERDRRKLEGRRGNGAQCISQLRDVFIPRLTGGVESIPGGGYHVVDITARPNAGESVEDAIRRVRGQIGSAQGELAAVRRAPPSAEEVREVVRSEIAARGQRGMPRLMVEGGGEVSVHWPDEVRIHAAGQALSAPAGSASALLCALFGPLIEQFLLFDVQEGGISADERANAIKQLEEQIVQLQHQEESLIVMAHQQGVEAFRNPMSCWAMLSLSPGPPAPVVLEAAE